MSSRLSRTYRLENGQYVELIHEVRPDGALDLDASRQSEDTLSKLDVYCGRIGGVASRTGVATFSRETHTLLSCTGSSPRSRAKQKENGASLPSSREPRSWCDPTMSIVMDGPGSVYRGDPGGFAVHADAEWEQTGAQVVSWNVDFLPGCNVGESATHQRWVWVSRAVVCNTGAVSLGIHEGLATIEACNNREYGFVTTDIWK